MIGLRKLNAMVMMNWIPTIDHSVTCQRVAAESSWRLASIMRLGDGSVQFLPQQWHAAGATSNPGREASMPAFICTTCGTQYPEQPTPPAGCAICLEPRQYVNPLGQSWTTLEAMRR